LIAWASVVRVADASDAGALADLHLRSAGAGFADIFSSDRREASDADLAKDWEALLRPDKRLGRAVFVAERDDRLIGVLVAGRDPADPAIGRLARAYIDPRFWGSGVVRLLFDTAVDHVRSLGCELATMWIMEPNLRARAAAEHLGMTHTGVRQPTCERATTVPAGVEDLEYHYSIRSDGD
jgi:RimJ/RimL family protein N-acetyltransferase